MVFSIFRFRQDCTVADDETGHSYDIGSGAQPSNVPKVYCDFYSKILDLQV